MAREDLKVARRYAKALFDLSAPDKIDQAGEALSSFAALWQKEAVLRENLTSPGVPLAQRLEVVKEIAEKTAAGYQEFASFLALLIRNKRISDLPAIARSYEEIKAEFKKILSLEVISAFELKDAEKSEIQKKVRERIPEGYASLISVSWNTHKELIGGLVIKAGDTVLDGSLSGALDRLARQLKA